MDDFSNLLGQYFNFRVEEAKAEATGRAQQEHSGTVETTANVNQAPTPPAPVVPVQQGFKLEQNHLLIGSAVILVVALVMNK